MNGMKPLDYFCCALIVIGIDLVILGGLYLGRLLQTGGLG